MDQSEIIEVEAEEVSEEEVDQINFKMSDNEKEYAEYLKHLIGITSNVFGIDPEDLMNRQTIEIKKAPKSITWEDVEQLYNEIEDEEND